MIGKAADPVFLLEWARYLRTASLSNLQVLTHRPTNPHEYAFLLEVASLIVIARTLPPSSSPAWLSQAAASPLLTPDYIANLLALRHSIAVPPSRRPLTASPLTFLIALLAEVTDYSQAVEESWGWKAVKLLVELGEGLEWSMGQVGWGGELRRVGVEWLKQTQMKQQRDATSLVVEWIKISAQIVAETVEGDVTAALLEKLTKEAKKVAQLSGLKYKSTKSSDLQTVKTTLLNLFQHSLSPKQSLSFAVVFCQLDAICQESGVPLSSICTMGDLLSHEHLFYSSLWGLEELGVAHHLTAFSAFMRHNSVRPVLEINRTITAHMTTPSPPLPLPQSLHNPRSLLHHFTLTPTALAQQVLLHFLEQSSITLPQGEKRRSRRSRGVKSLVVDPLHFLMVGTAFWEESGSRDVLQLALWITVDAYCKWVVQLKPKDCTAKETAEYLKKLNLAVVVFLLGLPYPTKMLQYYPIECDILKDLFVLPLFPTLILTSPFFFSAYNRQNAQLSPRLDSSIETWPLPWTHLLAAPKTMVLFLASPRGYQLASLLINPASPSFGRLYPELLLEHIRAELGSLNLEGAEGGERRQRLGQLESSRRKHMVGLLRMVEKGGEKTQAAMAGRYLQLLA